MNDLIQMLFLSPFHCCVWGLFATFIPKWKTPLVVLLLSIYYCLSLQISNVEELWLFLHILKSSVSVIAFLVILLWTQFYINGGLGDINHGSLFVKGASTGRHAIHQMVKPTIEHRSLYYVIWSCLV